MLRSSNVLPQWYLKTSNSSTRDFVYCELNLLLMLGLFYFLYYNPMLNCKYTVGGLLMISLTKIQQEVQGKSKGSFIYCMTGIVYSFMLIYDR